MRDFAGLERLFIARMGLERRPIAISFCDSAPPGVAAFTGTEPAGCGFWRLAAGGQTFYTKPEDHYNCPVGCYTHNIPLPPERQPELEQTLGLMAGIGYLRWEEVPAIARLAHTPAAVVYSPLAKTPLDPDVVLFAGRPGAMMLLQEAALRGGVAAARPLLARPTCMALPAALAGGTVASNGCIGNRVYTGIGDDEMYLAMPGKDVFGLAAEVETITTANARLAEHHRARLASLRSE
jgi:uncharacterized protein (DUF169 family)